MTTIDRLLTTPLAPLEYEFADSDNLVGIGGDLSPARLVQAYCRGVFPWFNDDDPILWWSPQPRCVFVPAEFVPSRSVRRSLRLDYEFTLDGAFGEVIRHCARPRKGQENTWITHDMLAAYVRLHRLGIAHSAEVWQEGVLVGGVYGVAIGSVFYGESMFSGVANGSKIALARLLEQLQRWQFTLFDCQVASAHLLRLGARDIARADFIARVERGVRQPGRWGVV